MPLCVCSNRCVTSANCSAAPIRPMASPCALRRWRLIMLPLMPACKRSNSRVCRTTSAASVSGMAAAMSRMPSTGLPARPCPSSATCVRGCSRLPAATCSTRYWLPALPTAAGSGPKSVTCWHSPIAAVFFRRVNRNVQTLAWPFWTCILPARCGARARLLRPARPRRWRRR
ncbi:hypothetical protein D3C81_1729030 [compost metagenome]